MINYTPDCQLKIGDFTTPFQASLSSDNRWVALAGIIPWDQLAEVYYRSMAINKGRKSLSARIVIGALIIKHMLNLSDRETLVLISENPYMQYFLGLSGFQAKVLFDASLFVKIRERMGEKTFDEFNTILIQEAKKLKPNKKQRPPKKASATSNGTETSLETSPSTLEAENKLELEVAERAISQGRELAKEEKAFIDEIEVDQTIAKEEQEQEWLKE